MPMLVGLLFFPALLLSVWVLNPRRLPIRTTLHPAPNAE